MRLLFAIKGLVVPGGGAERVFGDVVNALVARGHHVEVATFDQPGQALFYTLNSQVPVHPLGAGDPGVPTPRSNIPKIMAGMRRLAKERKPDVVVAFMHSTYVPVAFGLIGTGVPLVLSEHTSAAHFKERRLQRALVRLTQRISYAKTVVSEVIRDEHPPDERGQLVVLPNPVDLAAFAAAADAEREKLILCVGGLRVEKRQDLLVRAFDSIAGNYPDWRLRLVGDGVLRQQIEALVANAIHGNRIEIAGIKKDVAGEYGRATIVAMPSAYEALPMAAIEAMASARPIIGFSDCAGARSLIEDGVNGLLVEPRNDPVASFALAMAGLIENTDEARRLGAKGPASVARFGLDRVIDQWESLLGKARAGSSIKNEAPELP